MTGISEIIRLEESYGVGTFGVLTLQKQVFCVTLEPPDIENAPNISSIPAQQYICEKYSSKNHPKTWQIMNVPFRTLVLFHAGNIIYDTEACILLGEYFGKLRENRAIRNSGKTFEKFIEETYQFDKLHLTIKECY